MAKKTVWETLRSIDVSEYTKKKNGMTYLSWAHAWGALKDVYPDATFEKHVEEGNIPYMIDVHGFAYVRVTVTASGESATELFPVLDYKNSPIKNPNAFQINTAHQRAMTKAMGYLGLGHYIYAGEDLPPDDGVEPQKPAAAVKVDREFQEINAKKPKAKPASPPPSATETSSGDVKKNASEENWDTTKALISEVVKASSDIQWLNGVYRKNLGPINQLKDNSPKLYEELMNDFSKRKSELNSKGDQS
ncbi:DUF1071 domain-containing protein [Alphaproteobacteria bacterium]|nr:DUF1071 domain-containing protein [Alphaproteobacteria bacterium]